MRSTAFGNKKGMTKVLSRKISHFIVLFFMARQLMLIGGKILLSETSCTKIKVSDFLQTIIDRLHKSVNYCLRNS